MLHKVFLNKERIIEIVFDGPVGRKEVIEIGKLIVEIESSNLDKDPLLMIAHLNNYNGELDQETFNSSVMVCRDIPFIKLAIIVPNIKGYDNKALDIIKLAGKDVPAGSVEIFESREKATDWLLGS